MTPDWFNYYGTIVIYLIGIFCWTSLFYVGFIKLFDWWALRPIAKRITERDRAVVMYKAGIISANELRKVCGLPEYEPQDKVL